MEKIVIIGGVAAGATAAAKARRISETAEIIMLEAGPDISFANCGLPYYIGGDIKSRSKLILQSPESFKEQYNIDVYTHTRVSHIDRKGHQITAVDTRSGEQKTFGYTKLILAQGGRPITPDLPGASHGHVFTLWTLEDMDKITRHIEGQKPKNAVVVGGGFIGLEMAEAMVKRNLNVHIVEAMPHVMNIMEAEIAGAIENELLAYGVDIHTGTSVTEITPNKVKLDNGEWIEADIVLLSIGVRPTLQLAGEAGLEVGEAGGLLVDQFLQTNDPDILAAGDMVEIGHRVNNKKVRIPLAGPANRQGRIAAENALGGKHGYKGALGTSVVRVFEMVAGTTGLSLKQALTAGINADAVTVHKEHHTSYYPNAEQVTVLLVYEKETGVVLGGQTVGYKGADKRLDVIATAVASKLSIHDLADIDFAYSPPIGTANDALNMAAYTAENKLSGFSPSVSVSGLDEYIAQNHPQLIDVRDIFAYERNHVQGAMHLPLEILPNEIHRLDPNKHILVYDENGKKGHQVLRMLLNRGFENVANISGGHTSMQRFARTIGYKNFTLDLLEIETKSVHTEANEGSADTTRQSVKTDGPIIVDVRTPEEFHAGAVPESINIPLDELTTRYTELGGNYNRDITVYCASGARSAYAEQFLRQLGYNKVVNGGGISAMMARSNSKPDTAKANGPLVIDVRTEPEFLDGAFPGAINIPLDELQFRIDELGSQAREITVYCASGARSAYAQRMLMQIGFQNVTNGGGIMQMMMHQT
jgi:NADPH-dependent 2,4-dienoyl-CoA reductase/sulfur reductase-like enzyme/rhodanese-related sulfurtransferase